MMKIEKIKNGNTMTMCFEGWLDVETSPAAQQEVEALPEDVDKLIIDCSKMEYLSSAGLRMLLLAFKKMSKKQGMTLTGANDDVRNVLGMSGFLNKFNVE